MIFVLILIVMDNGLSPLYLSHRSRCIKVLILIVMDNGLSPSFFSPETMGEPAVLILIVMDNGLSRGGTPAGDLTLFCLNPYCNG